MGNCQVTEAAAAIIQHPGGRVERMYWPTSAAEVMRNNPGHHVALVTLCTLSDESHGRDTGGDGSGSGATVRFTRVRLLKPRDMLVLGQVYRLVTTQEVNKALQARKDEKMKQAKAEFVKRQQQQEQHRRRDDQNGGEEAKQHDPLKVGQESSQDGDRVRSSTQPPPGTRSRHWRPSLQSIDEAGS